ncbi:MAG: M20/M25/M40 family metallo-hydrolase [Armatimonadetes bacterium]|nr:M20/M25/M40 family metallo-hydrolase [Armatimonadota bacterium]
MARMPFAFAPALFVAAVLQEKAGPKLDSVTPKSVEAHLKFLASDLLEGRGTPSRGLDIAAEYIAAQFQLAGLEPGTKEGYFQITEFENRRTQVKAPVRNVIGVLRGTDDKLKDTYVLVTAHYDHLGMREGEGDQIFNGADDDGSGTVGVIECARALAGMKPKRTIVFMCFWGEEMGLRGSRHYVENPVFPLRDTVVDINLEQIGRTDDDEGPRVSEFNVTGYDYTDLAERLKAAAEPHGVKVTMHEKLSGPYFFASDNAAFAGVGVPANTVSTAYSFPDYHKPGDEWQKIDYDNTTKIVRSVCAGLWSIANDPRPIKWNEANEKTKRYVEAWKKLQGDQSASFVPAASRAARN